MSKARLFEAPARQKRTVLKTRIAKVAAAVALISSLGLMVLPPGNFAQLLDVIQAGALSVQNSFKRSSQ